MCSSDLSSTGPNSGYSVVAANAGLVYSYTVTGLTNGTSYWFRVTAVGQLTTGGSAVTSTRPAAYTSRVGSLTGTVTNRQVTLTWAAPTDLGGMPLLGYLISRCINYCDPSSSNYWTYYYSSGFNGVNDTSDRKSTRLTPVTATSRMPSSA